MRCTIMEGFLSLLYLNGRKKIEGEVRKKGQFEQLFKCQLLSLYFLFISLPLSSHYSLHWFSYSLFSSLLFSRKDLIYYQINWVEKN